MDERALDFGFQALDRATADGEHELDAFRKGIEAYEAARWRPIAEARRDVPVLVCLVDTRGEVYIATRDDDWRFDTYDDELTITHQDLIDRGALFMELPCQNPVDRSPEAEAGE